MRYGINLPNYGPLGHRSALIDITEAAESLGYSSAWTTDHQLMPAAMPEPYGSVVESLATLAFLAGRTRRLVFGSSIIVLPLRDPVLLAKQAAAVFELSDGRFVLGVGVGWVEGEYDLLGRDFSRRGQLADEYLEVMRELWTSPEPEYKGRTVSFSQALFAPRPERAGGVPVIVGGASPVALRRAARFADGWQAIHVGCEDIAAARALLTAEAPHKNLEISLRLRVQVNGRVEQRIGPVLEGSADDIRAGIDAYAAAGVDHLIAEFKTASVDTFIQRMADFASVALTG